MQHGGHPGTGAGAVPVVEAALSAVSDQGAGGALRASSPRERLRVRQALPPAPGKRSGHLRALRLNRHNLRAREKRAPMSFGRLWAPASSFRSSTVLPFFFLMLISVMAVCSSIFFLELLFSIFFIQKFCSTDFSKFYSFFLPEFCFPSNPFHFFS